MICWSLVLKFVAVFALAISLATVNGEEVTSEEPATSEEEITTTPEPTTTAESTPNCIHGTAPAPDQYCTECLKSYSGPTCNVSCSCATGSCIDGPSGSNVCAACWPGFYGPNCTRCMCLLGTCDNRIDPSAGHCVSCYSEHLRGEDCDSCATGRYGSICQYVCECIKGVCHEGLTGTGRCIPGTCATGFYGHYCNSTERTLTIPITRTVSLSLVPPTTTILNTTTTPVTTAPSTTPPENVTLRPIVAILIVFIERPSNETTKNTLSVLLDIPFDSIDLEDGPMNHSLVVTFNEAIVTRNVQLVYYDLLANLRDGAPQLAEIGVRGFVPAYQWSDIYPTTLPPATNKPITIPPGEEESKGLKGGYVLLIVLAALIVVGGILYGFWILYINRVKRHASVKRRERVSRIQRQHLQRRLSLQPPEEESPVLEQGQDGDMTAINVAFPQTLVPPEEEFVDLNMEPDAMSMQPVALPQPQDPKPRAIVEPTPETRQAVRSPQQHPSKSPSRRLQRKQKQPPPSAEVVHKVQEVKEAAVQQAHSSPQHETSVRSPLDQFIFPAESQPAAQYSPSDSPLDPRNS